MADSHRCSRGRHVPSYLHALLLGARVRIEHAAAVLLVVLGWRALRDRLNLVRAVRRLNGLLVVPRVRRNRSSATGCVDGRDVAAGGLLFLPARLDDHVLLSVGRGLLLLVHGGNDDDVLVSQVHLLSVFQVAGLRLGKFALLRVGQLDDVVRLLKRSLFFNGRSAVLDVEARLVQ